MSEPDNAELAVLGALADAEGHLPFSALEERVTIDSDDIEEALNRLQGAGQVEYSGRNRGYKLTAVPDHETCAVCGNEIERGTHYRLRAEARGPTDASMRRFSLHTRCATVLTAGLEQPGT